MRSRLVWSGSQIWSNLHSRSWESPGEWGDQWILIVSLFPSFTGPGVLDQRGVCGGWDLCAWAECAACEGVTIIHFPVVLSSKFNNIYKHSGSMLILFPGFLPFFFGKMCIFVFHSCMLNFRNKPMAKLEFAINLKDDSVMWDLVCYSDFLMDLSPWFLTSRFHRLSPSRSLAVLNHYDWLVFCFSIY